MMTMTSNLLKATQTEIERWWDDYRQQRLGWAYLKEPSPVVLTTMYAKMVVEGSIPVSKPNMLACKRHLHDLEIQGTDDFPWVFDEEKAHRPIRFIEQKCSPSKGARSQLVMQPWQHFAIGSLFGWVHRDTGIRRYREGLVFVGRKNGKTTLQSGLADYMAGFDGERGANIYFLANSQSQANILFEESKSMIQSSEFLSKRFKVMSRQIIHTKSKSKMVAMSSEKKDKDGENVHFAVFDEIHEYQDTDLISLMKQARGTRTQPLIMFITTAGKVLDGPLMDYIEQGEEVLSDYDSHLDDRFFYYLARLDDPDEADNPEMWVKANPNMCLMEIPNLISDYKSDKRIPAEYANWLTKQFNIFSSTDELSFVTPEIINKNTRTIPSASILGRYCVGGYDLSETEDFTSAGLEFPLDDGSVFWLNKSWIPESRFKLDKNQDRLREWEKQGYLEIIPEDYVQYEYVYDWFVEQSKKYKIQQINYDPNKALFLNQALKDKGFKTEVVKQGFVTLGGPMQNIKELLLDGKLITNNNRMFRWYLNNVKLVTDRNNNWMPTKQSRNRKIDGFAAFLTAHATVVKNLNTNPTRGRVKFVSFKDL